MVLLSRIVCYSIKPKKRQRKTPKKIIQQNVTHIILHVFFLYLTVFYRVPCAFLFASEWPIWERRRLGVTVQPKSALITIPCLVRCVLMRFNYRMHVVVLVKTCTFFFIWTQFSTSIMHPKRNILKNCIAIHGIIQYGRVTAKQLLQTDRVVAFLQPDNSVYTINKILRNHKVNMHKQIVEKETEREKKNAYPAFCSNFFSVCCCLRCFFFTGKSRGCTIFFLLLLSCLLYWAWTKHRVMQNSTEFFFACDSNSWLRSALKPDFLSHFRNRQIFKLHTRREREKSGSDGLRNIISSKNRLCMKIEIIVWMNYRRMMCAFFGFFLCRCAHMNFYPSFLYFVIHTAAAPVATAVPRIDGFTVTMNALKCVFIELSSSKWKCITHR